jgi:hypothetical protein
MTLDEFRKIHKDDATVTAEELQPLLNMSPDRIREYARTGEFPIQPVRSGRCQRFPKEAVIAFCEQRKPENQARHRCEMHFAADSMDELIAQIRQFVALCT